MNLLPRWGRQNRTASQIETDEPGGFREPRVMRRQSAFLDRGRRWSGSGSRPALAALALASLCPQPCPRRPVPAAPHRPHVTRALGYPAPSRGRARAPFRQHPAPGPPSPRRGRTSQRGRQRVCVFCVRPPHPHPGDRSRDHGQRPAGAATAPRTEGALGRHLPR